MYKKKKRLFYGVVSLMMILLLTGWAGPAQSKDKYPTRPITIIIPVPPGAGTDANNRIIAYYASKKWGVPVNVVNKPGGNKVPACLEVYKARPNGYTMLGDTLISSSAMFVVKPLPFKIMDRVFCGRVAITPLLLMLPANSPYKTLKEVAERARKDPATFTWTSNGGADTLDYLVRQFLKNAGVDVRKTKPVIGKGGSEATANTAGGHVILGSGTTTGILPAFQSNLVRPLGISGEKRNPKYPDVPTFKELGYPTLGVTQWYGISGPPKLPSHIADMWEQILREMVKDPTVLQKLANVGATPFFLSGKENRQIVLKDMEEMKELFK
jgi:tripartite-type tricarboxylate transporter receptor subunit TctC